MTKFTYKNHQVELRPRLMPLQDKALILIDGEFKLTRGLYTEQEAAEVARKIIDAQLEPAATLAPYCEIDGTFEHVRR